jgi:hypothetical protein
MISEARPIAPGTPCCCVCGCVLTDGRCASCGHVECGKCASKPPGMMDAMYEGWRGMDAEREVRAYWDMRIDWIDTRGDGIGVLNGFGGIYRGILVQAFPQPESAAWLAAKAFTDQHKKEVAELRREIVTQEWLTRYGGISRLDDIARTIARLQSLLSAGLVGVKKGK